MQLQQIVWQNIKYFIIHDNASICFFLFITTRKIIFSILKVRVEDVVKHKKGLKGMAIERKIANETYLSKKKKSYEDERKAKFMNRGGI